MFRCVSILILAGLCVALEGCSNPGSVTAPVVKRSQDGASSRASPVEKIPALSVKEQRLENTISVISGEGANTYSRTLDSLAEILSEHRMRLQSVSSQGHLQDVLSLLHRTDIDAAIVQADALEGLAKPVQSAARERLRYLFHVSSKAVHILVPRDITDVYQLAGRKVNIDKPGSGTNLTASAIFRKLGIDPEFTTYDQDTAYRRLQSGEIQASILLAPHPSTDILAFPSSGRFHLLPISLGEHETLYRPSQFTADEYPHLIDRGQQVGTIEVGRVLAVRDWPKGSSHYRRLERLLKAIDAHHDELRKSGQDPGRSEIDLQTEPGWQRFEAAQTLLDMRTREADALRAFEKIIATSGICSTPISPTDRERLYRGFIDWQREQERRTTSQNSGSDLP